MTKEQAVAFIGTFYRKEVDSRCRKFKETDSIRRSIDKVAGFLTGASNKYGLLLCGNVGNGKTTMLWSITKLYSYLAAEGYIELNNINQCFEFVSAKDLALFVITDRARFDKLKSCNKLIIDDLGEDATEIPLYGVNYTPVKDVIMERYEKGLVTIISSNLNSTQIKDKYHDERLSDRMREMFYVVAFEDRSFR